MKTNLEKSVLSAVKTWSSALKWKCPSCQCWVRDEISVRCVECQNKLRRVKGL
jgi:hypothetical protein